MDNRLLFLLLAFSAGVFLISVALANMYGTDAGLISAGIGLIILSFLPRIR